MLTTTAIQSATAGTTTTSAKASTIISGKTSNIDNSNYTISSIAGNNSNTISNSSKFVKVKNSRETRQNGFFGIDVSWSIFFETLRKKNFWPLVSLLPRLPSTPARSQRRENDSCCGNSWRRCSRCCCCCQLPAALLPVALLACLSARNCRQCVR